MKILLVLGKLYEKTVEGTQKSVINLANELVQRGHEVSILTRSNHRNSGRPESLKDEVQVFRMEFSLVNIFAIRRKIKEISPDVLNPHTTSWKMMLFAEMLSLGNMRSNLLTTFPTWFDENIFHKTFSRPSKISAVTESVANKHSANFVTPYGVDKDKYGFKDSFKNENLNVFFAGNPKQDRGFDEACEALAKVNREFKFNVAVADDLGEKSIARKKLKENNLEEKSEIFGYQENMPKFLKNQDVNINLIPSCKGITAPPILTLESMMTGVIPICSDMPEFEQLIGTTGGFTHRIDDKESISKSIESLVDMSTSELKESAKSVRKSVQKRHSTEESAKAFEEAYKQVI